MEEDKQQAVDNRSRKNMEMFIGELSKSVNADDIDSIFCITQRKDGSGMETAMIGNIDPFAMLGFTMFVQMRKMLQLIPEDTSLIPENSQAVLQ